MSQGPGPERRPPTPPTTAAPPRRPEDPRPNKSHSCCDTESAAGSPAGDPGPREVLA